MKVQNKEYIAIQREQDLVIFRTLLLEMAVKIGMTVLNQTKLITAGSELVRNMLKYAGKGEINMEIVNVGRHTGIKVIFKDKGPGIPDLKLAMTDGFSTGKSLGLGLPGAKRLSNEFDIQSEVGKGTVVTITRFKNGV